VRAFACQNCQQLVFFENSECLRCGSALGFVPEQRDLLAFSPPAEADGTLTALRGGSRHRRCANALIAGCNWVVPADDSGEGPELCASCRLTRTRPADDDPVGMAAFLDAETAKRRLVFQLLELGLPIVSRLEDPETGLAFDLLSSTAEQVVTGHENGVVTIDLAESDHAHRVRVQEELGEPYRLADGMLVHAELLIGDSVVMVKDAGDDDFRALLCTYWPDVDAAWERAVAAGAEVVFPLSDQFYGERSGRIGDPFGNQWMLCARIEALSHAEIAAREAHLDQ